MRRLILVSALALVALPVMADGELSFRGITPGCTLAEIKPQVKAIHQRLTRLAVPPSRTADETYGLMPPTAELLIEGMGGLDHAPLTVAGIKTTGNALFFVKTEDALRLSTIIVKVDSQSFDSLLLALTSKYGSPSKSGESDVQNGIGNHFQNVEYTWNSGSSRIVAERFGGDVAHSSITYSFLPLVAQRAAMNAKLPPPSDL
jgi:hypothetical protein